MAGRTRQAFYVKCRPQDCDAIRLVVKYNRVFIGYPPWVRGTTFDQHNVKDCVKDISISGDEWDPGEIDQDSRGVNHNREYALKIGQGDFVLVPRPGRGIAYLGRIAQRFELVKDPPWAEEYLSLRKEQNLDITRRKSHIGDMVQTWRVMEPFKEVIFPLIPRWISYLLLSRNTIGWIRNRPDGTCLATDVLDKIYNGSWRPDLPPTRSAEDVASRLLDWVSPNTFEHVVCSLLQLEQPQHYWFHSGGTGDGGTDGIAIDVVGRVVAAVQCKWKTSESPTKTGVELHQRLAGRWGDSVRVFVATLYDANTVRGESPNVTVLNVTDIAALIVKHRTHCDIARTLRVA